MKKLSLVALVLLAGCMSSGTKVSDQQARSFAPGTTTMSDVTAALGRPSTRSTAIDGQMVLGYSHTSAYATPATYVPIVGLLAGGSRGASETTIFMFDRNGVLTHVTTSSSDIDFRSGLLNQQ
jgi:hypothetical protein